jgi:hypothetical protein
MTFKPDTEADQKVSLLYQMGLSTYKVARRMGKGWNSDRVLSALKRTQTPRRTIKEAKSIKGGFF